jgi:hypothetical protein
MCHICISCKAEYLGRVQTLPTTRALPVLLPGKGQLTLCPHHQLSGKVSQAGSTAKAGGCWRVAGTQRCWRCGVRCHCCQATPPATRRIFGKLLPPCVPSNRRMRWQQQQQQHEAVVTRQTYNATAATSSRQQGQE